MAGPLGNKKLLIQFPIRN